MHNIIPVCLNLKTVAMKLKEYFAKHIFVYKQIDRQPQDHGESCISPFSFVVVVRTTMPNGYHILPGDSVRYQATV